MGCAILCAFLFGGIAQLVERLNGIQKVRGSTPLTSTIKEEGNETSGCSSFFVLKGLILQCLSGFEGVECGRIGRI